MTTFRPSCGKNLTSVLGCHSRPEAMLVPSLPVAWLKCPFHILKLLSNDLLKKQDLQFIILLLDKQALLRNQKGIHIQPATSYPQC
jgi:hypothetical protein